MVRPSPPGDRPRPLGPWPSEADGAPDERRRAAAEQALYEELRAMAARMLRRFPGTVRDPASLVSDTWLRIADRAAWSSREHFLASASRAMRSAIIDLARRGQAARRAGAVVTLSESLEGRDGATPEQILAVDEALTRLEAARPRHARVVQLRYFAGLHEIEVAEVLGVSLPTVKRDWSFARAWLLREIERAS